MSRRRADVGLTVLTTTAGLVAGMVLIAVAAVVLAHALPALQGPGAGALLTSTTWQPSADLFGALALLTGTILVALLALAGALVVGTSTALASAWLLPPRVAAPLRVALLIAAGIPSVVWGLWGLTAVVPLLGRWSPPGTSWLAASVVLAAMLTPTVAISLDAHLRTISSDLRRATAALGLGRWSSLRAVALPALQRGLVVGGVLALARALGETMAILLVAGNVVQIPSGLGDPLRTLTATIALEMGYASGQHLRLLFALGGLSLLLVIGVLLATRRWTQTAEAVPHA